MTSDGLLIHACLHGLEVNYAQQWQCKWHTIESVDSILPLTASNSAINALILVAFCLEEVLQDVQHLGHLHDKCVPTAMQHPASSTSFTLLPEDQVPGLMITMALSRNCTRFTADCRQCHQLHSNCRLPNKPSLAGSPSRITGTGFYRLHARPVTQATVSKHWRQLQALTATSEHHRLTLSFYHWPTHCWWRAVALFTPALQCQDR